jgi:hypothetical protein
MRPVTHGAPVKIWKLDCADCEPLLRGDSKKKIIHMTPGDKERGIPGKMMHVPDADPHWSTTPEGIPQTPDEQHIFKLRTEQGRRQLEMLQAYAALSKVPGLDLRDFAEAQWMLDQTLDPLRRPAVEGRIVCASGHDNLAGTKFCGECGVPMDVKKEIEPPPGELFSGEPVIPLEMLHIATLRKKCREQGLSDRGTKVQLIGRLSA